MKTRLQGESKRTAFIRHAEPLRGENLDEDLSKLRSLDRFLGKLLEDCWQELSHNLGGNRGVLESSGILPLGDPGLLPYLDQPGVFLLLGPAPSLAILFLGYSHAPMAGAISAKLLHLTERRGDKAANASTPTYAACISMEEEWSLVRPYWALLNRRI